MKRVVVLVSASLLCLSCGPQQGTSRTGGNGVPDGGYGSACSMPPRDSDGDGTPDYKDTDSDNDGIPDAVEGRNGNPCMAPLDSDGDGKPDYLDLDSDDVNDATVGDREEVGPDPTNPVDTDGDGIPDYIDPDNDGDGIPDRLELTAVGAAVAATKLADAPDTDGDGI